ncbi:MAG: DUF805 domain-containing protein [Tranquillimonas sp.]
MGFAQAIRTCFRKYATFSGRASRPEYWYFALFVILGNFAAGIFDGILNGIMYGPGAGAPAAPLSTLFWLGTPIPGLAAAWRRMHDTGRSGLYVLYPLLVMVGMGTFMAFAAGLVPVLGDQAAGVATGATMILMGLAMVVLLLSPILVIWWLTRPGQPGRNRYGPNPQEAA